jgi:lysozyme family protein
LQRVLNELGARPPLEVDGDIGPGTMTALKVMDQKAVYRRYKQGRIEYYQDLVAKRPALGKFLKGWLIRVDSFPDL